MRSGCGCQMRTDISTLSDWNNPAIGQRGIPLDHLTRRLRRGDVPAARTSKKANHARFSR